MEYTRTNWIGNLVAFAMLGLLSSTSLSAQELIRGKLVKTGVWEGQQVEYLEGEIAVILNPNVGKSDVLPLLQSHGATIRRDFDKLGWGLIELPDTVDVLSLAAELKRNPMIEAAEPNMVIRAHFNPNDPYYQDGHQWALKNTGQSPPGGTSDADIDAPEAWNITRGSSSIIIAILDSGIPMVSGSLSHPDLNDAGKFILGPDYIDSPPDGVRDGLGHGTHVTGIASAETNNGTGIAGVAGNCKVMVIQVFNANGGGSWEAFRDGVEYAADNGADVINFSGGGRSSSPTGELAVQYAYNHGVVLIASSGNNNSYIGWPAAYSTSYSNVIAVGATQYEDLRASYSNYGSQLNVVAPGGAFDGGYPVDAGDIYSTMPNYTVTLNGSPYYASQNYGYLPGTSMAAPHVSGLAGLILSLNSSLTPVQVRKTIELSADDKGAAGRDNYYGYGRINANKAVHNLYVPQVYATIQSAINAAVSGQTVYVSSGSYSGFDMKEYVDVHGAGKTNTDILGEVEFNGINYSELTDVNVRGIVINSGWGNEITDVRVSTNRIEINYGYWNYLNGVDTYNIGLDREIYIYNGAAEIDGFISSSSKDYGIYVNGDELYIYGDYYEAEITDKWNAIYLTGYAEALVDDIYFCYNDYDIWAASGSSAEAGSGTIFSGHPGSKTYGDVSYPDPWEDCGSLKKSIVADEGISVGGLNLSTTPAESDDPGLAEYQQALEVYRAIRQKLRLDIKAGKTLDLLQYAPEFSTAVDRFKQMVSKYPGSPSSIKALSKVAACYWALNQPQSLSDYLNTIVDNPRYAVLKPHARSLLIPYHLHVRDYHQALQVSDEILADPPDENLSCDALYGKGIIYLYYVEDTTRAAEAFQQVLALYPDNPTAVIAQAYLEELGETVPIPDEPATAPEPADELALAGYPNPFNPTATIRFGLPEAGRVTLVVYDLMGREVLRLAEGYRDAGWQAVVWNGRDARGREVPTGIYVARIMTPQGTKAIKLVMMK